MKVFFDNCTSPTLATTVDGFVQHYGHSASHIKDLPCGRNAKDVEWIKMLGEDKSETWIIVTGDTRIQKNPAERAAFRQAHLRGFVLAPAYQKTPLNQQASFLLWRWPDIEQFVKLTSAPFLFEVPMSKSSRIKQLPL
ncbi:hypothetical protein [Microvirga mediterraneensis]|uniref:VapC45 PIN like domain-containing protein n=1 Tax=Microvirga mediterraneensis TaxID=2754695 RepID=A0A838BWM9_9HYPH|nr:hypothetical protein [Microvirga mediterraneensis]MBA1158926.1 hypothetical protein [Microvirga mediterraneensis]